MALTVEQQRLFDVAAAALPPWFGRTAREREDLEAAAKIIDAARARTAYWSTRAQIEDSDGATADEPDWLNQHARDRDTHRALGESDASLWRRITNIKDAVTRPALLAALREMLTVNGLAPDFALDMVELPRDGIFLSGPTPPTPWTQVTGTGGVFVGPASGVMTFTPTVKFPIAPYHQSTAAMGDVEPTGSIKIKSGRIRSYRIVISGAANAGNNGTFSITGLDGNGVKFTNAGTAATDPTVTWALQRRDVFDQVVDGAPHSFLGGGERMTAIRPTLVAIIGYISNAAQRARVAQAAAEILRQKAGGGVLSSVEARAIP